MIVGGTFGVKPTIYGAWTALTSGRMGGKTPASSKPNTTGATIPKKERLRLGNSISTIPFFEPGIRIAFGIHPLQGSFLHLHQISFALSILMNPVTQEQIKDLSRIVGEETGIHPTMSGAEWEQAEFERNTGIELGY